MLLFLLEVFDSGGERNERKKWIHMFDGSPVVFFVVNLDDYRQLLFEDNTENKMVENIKLFGEIINSAHFKNSCIILFLNGKDLFESNIKEFAILDQHDDFADYAGKPIISSSYIRGVLFASMTMIGCLNCR